MASKEAKVEGEQPKPAKRQRKVSFSAVSSAKEMQEGLGTVPEFSPDFAERFFGEEGKIYGYKDLKIVVWLHAFSFYAHVEICHSEIIQLIELCPLACINSLTLTKLEWLEQDLKGGKKQVTNLQKIFKEIFGEGLIEERDIFLQRLTSNNNLSDVIHQYGKRLAAWKISDNQESGQSWIKVHHDTPDVSKEILLVEDLTTNEVRDWHSRLTPLVLMFIEAARPIEKKDPRWEVYLCLEKASCDPESPWRLVGFCTVYKFFKYPDSTRLRVSQILVLPPYQCKQNGLYLLEAVYKTAVERDSFEVTMEEPSNDLQVLRECMDAVRLLSFEPVRSDLHTTLLKLRMSSKPQASVTDCQDWMPSPALVEKVRQEFKICRLQFQYCWQVLIYLHVMHGGEENTLATFRNLVAWLVKIEFFGNPKSSNVGNNKQLVDVENEYDSSRTFVMFKVKPSLKDEHDGIAKGSEAGSEHLEAAVDMDPEDNVENAYQGLLKEREEEIHQVAEKVLRHLKGAGTSLVLT